MEGEGNTVVLHNFSNILSYLIAYFTRVATGPGDSRKIREFCDSSGKKVFFKGLGKVMEIHVSFENLYKATTFNSLLLVKTKISKWMQNLWIIVLSAVMKELYFCLRHSRFFSNFVNYVCTFRRISEVQISSSHELLNIEPAGINCTSSSVWHHFREVVRIQSWK